MKATVLIYETPFIFILCAESADAFMDELEDLLGGDGAWVLL